MPLLERLEQMALSAYNRDYKEANKHYIALTLGNKKWHNAYHGGEGKSNKGFKLCVQLRLPAKFLRSPANASPWACI